MIEKLWNDLALFFENNFTLFDLTPQAVFLGFLNIDTKLLLLRNHLLLILKGTLMQNLKYMFTILGDLNR